jgi:hypothetical protein
MFGSFASTALPGRDDAPDVASVGVDDDEASVFDHADRDLAPLSIFTGVLLGDDPTLEDEDRVQKLDTTLLEEP